MKYLCILLALALISSCTSQRLLVDVGRSDLYENGISANYDKFVSNLYRLDIKPDQLHKDTIYRQLHSRSYDGIFENDSIVVAEKLALHTGGNWDAELNDKGYVLTKSRYNKIVGDTLYCERYDYSFDEKDRLVGVDEWEYHYPSKNTTLYRYKIDYTKYGQIKAVLIKNDRDSILAKRVYSFGRRKVTALTYTEDDQPVQQTVYKYDRQGRYVLGNDYQYLKNLYKETKTTYDDNGKSKESWYIQDENNDTIESGYELYQHHRLVEKLLKNHAENNGFSRHTVYQCLTDGRLAGEVEIFRQGENISRRCKNYQYEYDNYNDIKKTVTIHRTEEWFDTRDYLNIITVQYR